MFNFPDYGTQPSQLHTNLGRANSGQEHATPTLPSEVRPGGVHHERTRPFLRAPRTLEHEDTPPPGAHGQRDVKDRVGLRTVAYPGHEGQVSCPGAGGVD